MDSTAIELIQKTAIAAAGLNRLAADTPAIILTDGTGGEKIVSLEPFAAVRSRFRGTMSTPSFDDFVAYVKDVADNEVGGVVPTFVDVDAMAATTFFNLGDFEDPGHADWRAKLNLKPTAAFSALCDIDGKKLSQKALAEWLEDWNDFVSAEYEAGDGDLKRAITAIRKLTIDTRGSTTHGVTATSTQRSALEEIEAKADNLPVGFSWVCEPYVGLKQRIFRVALSVLTGGTEPQLVLRWVRREAVIEDIAKEFKTTLQERLDGSAEVSVGTFAP
jgi:uncharacterized protein YfdQ (DUF2303 family)